MEYDKYYQTENLFGAPYPELIDFYSKIKDKGKLLDLGCGQGRDAIPLAKLGFTVTGIDNSKVGIAQLNEIAERQNLSLIGIVEDIYSFSAFDKFDYILLDSMFHFLKKDREKETELLNRILDLSNSKTIITICIQKSGKKIDILNSIVSTKKNLKVISEIELMYNYEDKETNHSSASKYVMISVRKV